MSDADTLKVYAQKASEYAKLTRQSAHDDPMFTGFLAACTAGGHLLDLGCGPGHYAVEMARAGFTVTAVDAVPEMVALAATHAGVTAKQARFDEIDDIEVYDGIWANFSLLHAPREEMPDHLLALHRALKPGGVFHIALKTGEGSNRDKICRLYTYYTLSELAGLLQAAGFTPITHTEGNDMGLSGERADWIAVRCRG